jgi:hypothetical protein
MLLFYSVFAKADDRDANIQGKLQIEYGNCYSSFSQDVLNCNKSTCNYPDFSDSKAWKAHAIKGLVNGECYIIYYSYAGNQIIGSPDYCFYSKDQTIALSNLYRDLFSNGSIIDVAEIKNKIASLNMEVCRKKSYYEDKKDQ